MAPHGGNPLFDAVLDLQHSIGNRRTAAATEVTITYGKNAKSSAVASSCETVIKEIVAKAGGKSCTITSTARTPEDQARAMYGLLEKSGVKAGRALYLSAGEKVIDVYVASKAARKTAAQIKADMLAKINELGPAKVSKHCADLTTLCVVDIDTGSITNKDRFIEEVGKDHRVSGFLQPPDDPAYHLEIPVAGAGSSGSTGQLVDEVTGGGPGADVQEAAATANAPAGGDLSMVQSMIAGGTKDENRLTNAVFYARHPELAGTSITRGSDQAKEWLVIRDELVRPALAAPTTTSSAPTAAAMETPSEPGLIERGIAELTSLAEATYDMVASWFSSDEEATPPGTPASGAWIDTTAGEARFHTKAPTLEGSTLDIAKTRADKGDAGTSYSLKGDDLARSLRSGEDQATVFYCSGLSIWTLAAAGYDVSKSIVGANGVPYTYTHENGTEMRVTLKHLIDGEPDAVEAMTIAQQKDMKNGGSVGRLSGAGHALGHTADGAAGAVKGAAGAFELAGIGMEIPELEQKPGDFAQSRRTTAGEGNDTEVKHRGWGHAWQVWSVRAKGSAIFGQEGSPEPTGGALEGWHENVEFMIDKDTLPSLVGAHTVLKAKRIEANVGGAGTLANKASGGDGGVQITAEHAVPDTGLSTYTGYVVYYGRLGTSPWNGWTPATKP